MERPERPPVPRPRTQPGNVTVTPEDEKVKKFMELHNKAYELTNAAIKLDETGKLDQAFNGYQEALLIIDKAVDLAHTGGFPEDKVEKVDDLLYKMRMSRKEILERASDISLHQRPSSTSEYLQGPSGVPAYGGELNGSIRQPPSYAESQSPRSSISESQSASVLASGAYAMLNASLDEIAGEESACRNPLPLNAQEVFTIQENVQIYFISKDDTVSAPSYPSFLRVVVINQDQPQVAAAATTSQQPPAFIQIGDWHYPLWPGQSPIFETADGSYIFPDLDASGGSVGLILPQSLDVEQRKALEDLLLQLIGQAAFHIPAAAEAIPHVVEPKPPQPAHVTTPTETIGSRIAAGLISGADKLAHGIIYGAEKTSEYVEKGAAYLVTKIEPVQEKPNIRPEVRSGMRTARHVTGKAVKVSAYVVNQLSKGTVKLGQHVAPYVHRTATQLYAKTMNTNEAEASGKLDQVLEVTGGAVVGFGTVFIGLEHAATVLAKSIRDNTVTVVHHRYGSDAGAFCEDTTTAIGNSVVTGYNVKGLAPRALAKRVAKDTGKAIAVSAYDKAQETKTSPKKDPKNP